jgi:hypothetical protein
MRISGEKQLLKAQTSAPLRRRPPLEIRVEIRAREFEAGNSIFGKFVASGDS